VPVLAKISGYPILAASLLLRQGWETKIPAAPYFHQPKCWMGDPKEDSPKLKAVRRSGWPSLLSTTPYFVGITSSVIDCAGNVVESKLVVPFGAPVTVTADCATIAARFALL